VASEPVKKLTSRADATVIKLLFEALDPDPDGHSRFAGQEASAEAINIGRSASSMSPRRGP